MSIFRQNLELLSANMAVHAVTANMAVHAVTANMAVHAVTADASSSEPHVGWSVQTSQLLRCDRSTLSYPSSRDAAIAVTSRPGSTSQKSREMFTEYVMARRVW
jgi:hypothetical protein